MNWDAVRDKILEVIAACVRVDTFWRDREQSAVRANAGSDPDVVCRLHVLSTTSNGRDDFRRELNSGTNKLDITQVSIGRFTVSVLCESLNQSDTANCLNYVERVRRCMQRPQILALFRTVGITCTGVGQSVDTSYTWDSRIVSAANIDLSFAFVDNETSTDGPGLVSDDWIETVEGHRTDPDVPAPIDAELEGEHNG